jgi:hypothetical protein
MVNGKKPLFLALIIIVSIIVMIAGCTSEAESLDIKGSVEEYLNDKYSEVVFELIDYGKIPNNAQTYRFLYSDSNSHEFSVLAEGNKISDNYIEILLKEEITEIITEIINKSKYKIEKIHVGGVSYESIEGYSVYDCTEVGLDLIVSGDKISIDEANEFSQFLNQSLKIDIDIKKIMVVYRYSDSKTDGLLNHTVIIE